MNKGEFVGEYVKALFAWVGIIGFVFGAYALPRIVRRVHRYRDTLEFYADPAAWRRSHGIPPLDLPIPDFYDEYNFGGRAQEALKR